MKDGSVNALREVIRALNAFKYVVIYDSGTGIGRAEDDTFPKQRECVQIQKGAKCGVYQVLKPVHSVDPGVK